MNKLDFFLRKRIFSPVMAGVCKRPRLDLSLKEHLFLQKLANSRTAPIRTVQRAQILWHYHAGESIAEIERRVRASRNTIYKCIDKAVAFGVESGLHDAFHRPRKPVISEEDKCWVISIATTRPGVYGYPVEKWSRKLLADHIRKEALRAGHPAMGRASKATIQRILKPAEPKVRRVRLEEFSKFNRYVPLMEKRQLKLDI